MTLDIPNCFSFCRHLFERDDTDQNPVHRRCAAFPEGIPEPLIRAQVSHWRPYPGDNGIQYEPEPGHRNPAWERFAEMRHLRTILCDRVVAPLIGYKMPFDDMVARHELPDGFWDSVLPWLRRVEDTTVSDRERFVNLWVAFEGWATRVVLPGKRQDTNEAITVAAVGQDPALREWHRVFLELEPDLKDATEKFAENWPVLRVTELQALGIQGWKGSDRPGYLQVARRTARKHGTELHESPPCWRDGWHKDDNEPVPHDWPHTLNVIRQVRRNLFHGGKSFDVAGERLLVHYALRILWSVWRTELPAWVQTEVQQS